MINQDFIVLTTSGLYCAVGDFYLDPQQPVGRAVISHAHGDHAVPGNTQVFCTAPTAGIMELRYRKNAGNKFSIYAFGETFEFGLVKVTFFPAGHILGSAQVLMEFGQIRYLYTGDFKLQLDETCEQLQFVEADVLITETTFASPLVRHPNPVTEIAKLNDTHSNILLGAYSLGKAQRLIHLISENCSSKTILVHFNILPINKLYENFGFNIGNYLPYNRKLMKQPGSGFIYLVPPTTFDSYFRAHNVVRVFASGWKHRHQHNGMELFISDHADWNDIIRMINNVKPVEVWTIHGDGRDLKKYYENQIPIKILGKC